MKAPYFSIVIPVFNRRREIRRAMDSCLNQQFTDFELIVVDDASTDDSVAVIESYSDPRVKLVQHERNSGQCPARNTGVSEALADWIVFVDSDHALKPGALSRIHKQIELEGGEVDRIGFMQDWDTGIATPQPPPDGTLLDYEGWLLFIERSELSDFLLCTKRTTFEEVQFTESSILEMEYQLNCASKFSTRIIAEAVAFQYTDATNRLTASHSRPSLPQLKKRAADEIESKLRVLSQHGAALRLFAPRIHEITYRVLVLSCFIDGQWRQGLRYAAEYLFTCKMNLRGLTSIALASVWVEGFLRIRHQRMIRGT